MRRHAQGFAAWQDFGHRAKTPRRREQPDKDTHRRMTMRIYVLKNKHVDFSGRTSSSTPVVHHSCPRGEGSPMRGLIFKKTAAIAVRWGSEGKGSHVLGGEGRGHKGLPQVKIGICLRFRYSDFEFSARPGTIAIANRSHRYHSTFKLWERFLTAIWSATAGVETSSIQSAPTGEIRLSKSETMTEITIQ